MNNIVQRVAALTPEQRKVFEKRLRQGEFKTQGMATDMTFNSYNSIQPALEAPGYPKGCFPASAAQRRMYILNQLNETAPIYNITGVIRIRGEIQRHQLENAFQKLIIRHEALRTSFEIIEGEIVQKIHGPLEFETIYYQASESEVKQIIQQFIQPFELNKAPLMRVGLMGLGINEHILIYDLHHIISDGISMAILAKEFLDLYCEIELQPLRIQYKDYAAWQNSFMVKGSQAEGPQNRIISGALQKQEEFWLSQFQGEIPVLHLPADHPRPALQNFEGDHYHFTLEREVSQKITSLASNHGVTLYMLLLASLNILLSKYTGQEDIIIGAPIAGRPHADLENIIGIFINTLALRNHPKGEKRVLDFLAEVKTNTLCAYENQNYQFEALVEKLALPRELSRNPLFDVMLILQNMDLKVKGEIEGLQFVPYDLTLPFSKFDLTLEVIETPEGMSFNWEYCAKLFRRETIVRFAGHFCNLLRMLSADPEGKIAELEILHESEKRQILVDFNDTRTEYLHEKTIPDLFDEQVERTPEAIAAVFEEQSITYRELSQKTNQLARVLRRKGAKPDSIIGIMTERSITMIIGLIGILKAGSAYLPVDPEYPPERIKFMLEDSEARILLMNGSLELHEGFCGEILNLDNAWMEQGNQEPLEKVNRAEDLAYLIYTSGSTGKPKGVMIEHRAVHNFIQGITLSIPFTPDKTILALTTISFDIFGMETLLPLTRGLKIVIANENEQRDSRLLRAVIIKNKINMLQITPSRMQLLINDPESQSSFDNITEIMIGGEALPETLLNQIRQITGAKIYNMYGPTETTIWSTLKNVTTDQKITIGAPIANTRIYIAGPYNQIQPIGVPGELCIGGDGLARGYLNRPELTAERFILMHNEECIMHNEECRMHNEEYRMHDGECRMHNEECRSAVDLEHCGKTGTSGFNYELCIMNYKFIYKTGDLARWTPDGQIEFLGRMDNQVKVRGYRIELGEIETQLLKHEAVKEAVVITKDDVNGALSVAGAKYICAYLSGNRELTVQDLREYLAETLPDYMIPSYFIQLDKLPLTPNGKIDRKAIASGKAADGSRLPEPDGMITGREYVGPRNEIEEKLVTLWQDILGVKQVGIHDSFFELGGYSLKAMQMIAGFKEYPITITEIFKYPTVAKLSQYVQPALSQPAPFYETAAEMLDATHYPVKEKRIENISPFNEVLYKNCLYNAVFPVAFHFQRDILPIVANDINYYECKMNLADVSLETQTISVRPITEIIIELDIQFLSKPYSRDIVSDLVQAIIDEHPVALAVDCYYEPLRADTYQKQHWPHWILVYGFDLIGQKFEILEHSNLNNLDYAPRAIDFTDMVNIYQGYLTNFQKGGGFPSYFELFESASRETSRPRGGLSWSEQISYPQVFVNNISANYTAINNGLELLPVFQKYLKSLSSDEANLQKKLPELLFQIHEVAKVKSAEKYAISRLFGLESDLFGYLNGIVDNWNMLRVVLDMYRMTSVYRPATLERVIGKLSETKELEEQYLNGCLLSFEQFLKRKMNQ